MSNDKNIPENALKQLFTEARTYYAWQDKKVPHTLLNALYDLCKMAPTGANCQPMRLVFVETSAAKEKLKPSLSEGNIEKTMTAPVTAIIAMDMAFYEHLPFLFPHVDAKSWFEGNDTAILNTAQQNTAMQAGYFIMAARALGLDCGPMGGFNADMVDETFLSETSFKSTLLINLGYGDASTLHERAPRFDFDTACNII